MISLYVDIFSVHRLDMTKSLIIVIKMENVSNIIDVARIGYGIFNMPSLELINDDIFLNIPNILLLIFFVVTVFALLFLYYIL